MFPKVENLGRKLIFCDRCFHINADWKYSLPNMLPCCGIQEQCYLTPLASGILKPGTKMAPHLNKQMQALLHS